MFEPGETLPFVKKEEGKKQNSQESICSIKCGLLILFILLIFALAVLLCLHYLEVVKLPDRGLKTREVGTQKEAMVNEEISKLKNNASILMDTISSQKKAISEKEAAIASRGVDINRLKDKINELAPEHISVGVFLKVLSNLKVILLGGWLRYHFTNSTTIYNSMEQSWKNCNLTLPGTLGYHGAVILNNEIYVFGGFENGTTQEFLKSLYKLGAGNKWERMADMTEKKGPLSQSSVVFNSEIWVISGYYRAKVLKSVEKYNPKTNKWTEMPELNESRAAAAATVVDGKIYVSGGWNGWTITNSVEVYDPEKGKWKIFTPSMPYRAHSHILIGNHSHLIIIGGELSIYESTNQVWKIDASDPKREWKEMLSLKQKRRNAGAAIIADELMVFGGSINWINSIDSVEVFDGIEWKKGANLLDKQDHFASIPLTHEQERLFLKRFCQNS